MKIRPQGRPSAIVATLRRGRTVDSLSDMGFQLPGITWLLHGADVGAQAAQLFNNVLIAPLNVLNTADFALAVSGQGGDDPWRRRPAGRMPGSGRL